MPCQLAITSMSLGWSSASHQLIPKLKLAASYGYKGIELFHDDLRDLALRCFRTTSQDFLITDPAAEPSHAAQLAAARHVREVCERLGLTIICLQPFMGFEGRLDPVVRGEMMEKLGQWMELAHALGTDMIQIPSSIIPEDEISEDLDVMVQDLQEVADIGASQNPPLRFVYEALCFGTRVDRWETSWEIVEKVDRANFGLCLDSFNIAGRIYADPTSPSGRTSDAEEAVGHSLEVMVKTLDMSKVFYVQIVDAELLTKPLREQSFYDATQKPRMNWSRNCRLFYGEQDRGGYLPIKQIAETFFLDLKFEGWVSLELFNRRMQDEGEHVSEELARRGAVSWGKLVRDMDLEVEQAPEFPARTDFEEEIEPVAMTEARSSLSAPLSRTDSGRSTPMTAVSSCYSQQAICTRHGLEHLSSFRRHSPIIA